MNTQVHKQIGIIYISRTQMVLFVTGMSTPVIIPFPTDIVRDLDIVNQQKLITLLQSTTAQYKLPPSSLTVLLANDLLFAKQIVSSDPKTQAEEQQAFIDMVPYEDVSVQKIPFNTKFYMTVANIEFYQGVTQAFEANNFSVPLVLAAYIFSKEVNFANPLSIPMLTVLMQKAGAFKQFNFIQKAIVEEKQYAPTPDAAVKESGDGYAPPKKSNRVFILAGVFIMLIGILIAVYLWSNQSNPPPKKENAPVDTAPAVTATSAPVPTEKIASESSDVQGAKSVKITIVIGESSQNAILIEDALEKEGLMDIERDNTSSTGPETVINFQSDIPQVTKNKITTAVSRVYKKVIIQNSNTFEAATITLGK